MCHQLSVETTFMMQLNSLHQTLGRSRLFVLIDFLQMIFRAQWRTTFIASVVRVVPVRRVTQSPSSRETTQRRRVI